MPGLAGVGGIIVGAGAMLAAFASNTVAGQSFALAQQVRGDEQEREDASARERYRDQLFRTVEPAITALMEHQALWAEPANRGAGSGAGAVANVMSRMLLLEAVATAHDQVFVNAAIDVYGIAIAEPDRQRSSDIVTGLLVGLPKLLFEGRDVDELTRTMRDIPARLQRDAEDAEKEDAEKTV